MIKAILMSSKTFNINDHITVSPQAVIVTLIIATSYVTYTVIMSLDKGFRMKSSHESSTMVLIQLIASGLLHLALALAMFLIPLNLNSKGDFPEYGLKYFVGWIVATLAVGYSGLFLFTTVTSYLKFVKQRRAIDEIKALLAPVSAASARAFLTSINATESLKESILSVSNVIVGSFVANAPQMITLLNALPAAERTVVNATYASLLNSLTLALTIKSVDLNTFFLTQPTVTPTTLVAGGASGSFTGSGGARAIVVRITSTDQLSAINEAGNILGITPTTFDNSSSISTATSSTERIARFRNAVQNSTTVRASLSPAQVVHLDNFLSTPSTTSTFNATDANTIRSFIQSSAPSTTFSNSEISSFKEKAARDYIANPSSVSPAVQELYAFHYGPLSTAS